MSAATLTRRGTPTTGWPARPRMGEWTTPSSRGGSGPDWPPFLTCGPLPWAARTPAGPATPEVTGISRSTTGGCSTLLHFATRAGRVMYRRSAGGGGGVMNGGAWLTVGQRRVDVHYRDLDDVEHWLAEAQAGRFAKELLLFYVAGIPSYVLAAELATHVVLSGELPRPQYPALLAAEASRHWMADARASLRYAAAALHGRGGAGPHRAAAARAQRLHLAQPDDRRTGQA